MKMGGVDMTGFRMIPAGMGLMMPASAPWKGVEFVWVIAMWAVMMFGMMMPSVAPMILIYARVGRQAAAQDKPFAATGWFAAGYLLVWTVFALAATSAQWALERAAMLNSMMESTSKRSAAPPHLTITDQRATGHLTMTDQWSVGHHHGHRVGIAIARIHVPRRHRTPPLMGSDPGRRVRRRQKQESSPAPSKKQRSSSRPPKQKQDATGSTRLPKRTLRV